MTIAIPKFLTMKTSVIGLILGGCAPLHTHSHCTDQCPVQPVEYCQEIPPGYVLSQDKYDPNFVPCIPRPILPVPPPDDDSPDDDPADDDDDDDDDDEAQWSSTGGGNGASAEQGDQASDADAGDGAEARDGAADSADGQNTFSGGGRGAGATEGGVSIGANGGNLL